MALSAADLTPVLAGAPGAWDAFVPKAAAVMRAPIRRVLGAHGLADDIGDVLQDSFLRLIRDDCRLLRRYDAERATLATWLGIIATSTALDHLRRKPPAADALADHADTLPAPDAAAPREPLALPPDLLTPRQALILKLLYEDDRDPAEVAALLGIGAPSVRSLHHKALTRLRAFLGKPDGYE